jgi:hypothetical protein
MQRILSILTVTLSILSIATQATAQVVRTTEGHVSVDSGVYNFRTGELSNTSNVPLPTALPASVSEQVLVPHDSTRQAPNTVIVNVDGDEVRRQAQELSGLTVGNFTSTVIGTVTQSPGSHDYAEGLELNINGVTQSAFVRGDEVSIGSDGQPLPTFQRVSAQLGEGDEAVVRLLNIRQSGGDVQESGVYFTQDGTLITEDLENGGRLGSAKEPDFDDGNVFDIEGGTISGDLTGSSTSTTTESFTEDWNTLTSLNSGLLGFVDAEGNPTAANRLEVDSNGIGRYTHQLRPIGGDRPFLLNGTISVNPFAGDNEELANLSIGGKQFLTRTHRSSEVTVSGDRTLLLPPTFMAGNGQAAYSNVGGEIATYADGSSDFIVQWISDLGFTQKVNYSIEVPAGTTLIRALIAQQPRTDELILGEFLVMSSETETEKGFTVISERENPENFKWLNEVEQGVEDTLPTGNSAIAEFNGQRQPTTVDYNDAIVSLLTETPDITVIEREPNRFGVYVGGNAGIGVGNRTQRDRTIETTTTTSGQGVFEIDPKGMLRLSSLETTETVSSELVADTTSSEFGFTPVRAEAVLGGILNYAGVPWTEAASNISAELYGGTDSGLRAELRQNLGGVVASVKADYRFDGDTTVAAAVSLDF